MILPLTSFCVSVFLSFFILFPSVFPFSFLSLGIYWQLFCFVTKRCSFFLSLQRKVPRGQNIGVWSTQVMWRSSLHFTLPWDSCTSQHWKITGHRILSPRRPSSGSTCRSTASSLLLKNCILTMTHRIPPWAAWPWPTCQDQAHSFHSPEFIQVRPCTKPHPWLGWGYLRISRCVQVSCLQ